MARTLQEKLKHAESMVDTIEDTLAKLYAKSANSTSFGDQSITLQSIADLEKSRDKWRFELKALENQIDGKSQTLKIQFRNA